MNKCPHGVYAPERRVALYCSICTPPVTPCGPSYSRATWKLHDEWNRKVKNPSARRLRRPVYKGVSHGKERANSGTTGDSLPHIDRWQFDRRLRAETFSEEVATHIESDCSSGIRLIPAATPRKEAPIWALHNRMLWKVVTSEQQNGNVARRVAVAYLYWRCAWQSEDIADELRVSKNSIKWMLNRMARRAKKIFNNEINELESNLTLTRY